MDEYKQQVARRAQALLNAGMCVTTRYAVECINADLVDPDDLRGLREQVGGKIVMVWYLA